MNAGTQAKAVILLSSGLDSTVNLFAAQENFEIVLALTFAYGQRAAAKELSCAVRLSQRAGVPHTIVELPWFKKFGNSALLNEKEKVPGANEVSIDDFATSQKSAKSVWVPNRNGIFFKHSCGLCGKPGGLCDHPRI